jgi:hypothetical protein|tara:strand:- start:283 stop:447 length:165 start_codon:yes stop_codon:yes gene_type:complete
MPRGNLTKVDMMSRVLKLKHELYSNQYHHYSGNQKDSAHEVLNKVLDMINEYSY